MIDVSNLKRIINLYYLILRLIIILSYLKTYYYIILSYYNLILSIILYIISLWYINEHNYCTTVISLKHIMIIFAVNNMKWKQLQFTFSLLAYDTLMNMLIEDLLYLDIVNSYYYNHFYSIEHQMNMNVYTLFHDFFVIVCKLLACDSFTSTSIVHLSYL
jgi:hypothetical protein